MKALLLYGLAALLPAKSITYDWSPGENMKTAMVDALNKAYSYVSSSPAMGFADNLNFLGAFLSVGGDVSFSMSLDYGKRYVFVGGGGSDATDVDIIITSPNGVEYKDTQTDKTPIVDFTVYATGNYRIKLKHYSGSRSSFCCFTILKYGGFNIPAADLNTAVNRIISYGNTIYTEYHSTLRFHDVTNQFCMYGGLLQSGESLSITNINMGYNVNHWVMGAGDTDADDLDLCVKRNGTEVQCDRDSDKIPRIKFTSYGSDYSVELKNYQSSVRVFSLFSILTY